MLRITLIVSLAAIAFACYACRVQGSADPKPNHTMAAAPSGFAIVELFTSEGCSSCPPADASLAEIVKSSRAHQQPIYPLAFHVDYWNRLGWRDRFSSADYSARQLKYATSMHLEDIYTPQMIVNGNRQFVGSDLSQTSSAIESALATSSNARISLAKPTVAQDQFSIACKTENLPNDAMINVAVVERGLSSNVRSGENSGRTLPHENVVRWFTTLRADAIASDPILVPHVADVHFDRASLIVFAQKPDLSIVAAGATDFQ